MSSRFVGKEQLVYLYDLPKHIATSVKIAEIIKKACGIEIKEKVQFRDNKPHPLTGVPSPYQWGIVKVEP